MNARASLKLLSAMVMVLLAALMAWWLRPAMAQARHEALHEQVLWLEAQQMAPAVVLAGDTRESFRATLPLLPDQVARAELAPLLVVSAVDVSSWSVRRFPLDAGLVRENWRIPVGATRYPQLRRALADIFNAQAHAGLDRLSLEGSPDGTGLVRGWLELSLYYRSEP